MSKIEIKDCPFCGGKARLYYAPSNVFLGIPCYGVYCEKCHVMIGTVEDYKTDFYRTKRAAAKAWNRRVEDNKEKENGKMESIH